MKVVTMYTHCVLTKGQQRICLEAQTYNLGPQLLQQFLFPFQSYNHKR